MASLAAVCAVEVGDEVGGRVGGEGAEGGEALEHVARLLAPAELLLDHLVRLVRELRRPAPLQVVQEVIPRTILQSRSRPRLQPIQIFCISEPDTEPN